MEQKRIEELRGFDTCPDENTNAIEHFDKISSILNECLSEIERLQKEQDAAVEAVNILLPKCCAAGISESCEYCVSGG